MRRVEHVPDGFRRASPDRFEAFLSSTDVPEWDLPEAPGLSDATVAGLLMTDKLIRLAVGAPLARLPGAAMLYSTIGYQLLGDIVRRVGGQPLCQFARSRLFEPLSMRDSQFMLPSSLWLLPWISPTTGYRGEIDLSGGGHAYGLYIFGAGDRFKAHGLLATLSAFGQVGQRRRFRLGRPRAGPRGRLPQRVVSAASESSWYELRPVPERRTRRGQRLAALIQWHGRMRSRKSPWKNASPFTVGNVRNPPSLPLRLCPPNGLDRRKSAIGRVLTAE